MSFLGPLLSRPFIDYIGSVLQYFLISAFAQCKLFAFLMFCGAEFHSLAAFLENDSLAAVDLASGFHSSTVVGLRIL